MGKKVKNPTDNTSPSGRAKHPSRKVADDLTWGTQNNAGSATPSAFLSRGGHRERKPEGEEMSSSSSASASAVPPEDDVCSVCHDRFRIPCQANCSHWFCGKSLLLLFSSSSPYLVLPCPSSL